jgi:hypothetical protein
MSPRLPPRREPRVLAFRSSSYGFHYACADPWELRAVRSIRCRALSLGPAILRVIRREKPTLCVTKDPALKGIVDRAARRAGIPSGEPGRPTLPTAIARDLSPDLSLRAPTHALSAVAAVALSSVLYAETPIRHYAACRKRPTKHTARDPCAR